MTFRRLLLPLGPLFVLALAATLAAQPRTRPGRGGNDASAEPWQPIGLSGGGAMFSPAVSPHDAKLMFVSCDMGGFYRSDNGGESWRMLDQRTAVASNTQCQPAFHPDDEKIVLMAGDEDGSGRELKISEDAGRTWKPLPGAQSFARQLVTAIAFDPARKGKRILVGTEASRVWISNDAGKSFSEASGIDVGSGGSAAVRGFHVAPDARRRKWTLFAATSKGVFRSDDDGRTFESCSGTADGKLPAAEIRDFCGGSDDKEISLWCVVAGTDHGVYRSIDNGDTWQHQDRATGLMPNDEFTFCECPADDPDTCFVSNNGTDYAPPDHWGVWRTTNRGQKWEACYYGDPRWSQCNLQGGYLIPDFSYGWGGQASGFACSADGKTLMFTNAGEVHVSSDAGKSWAQRYVTPAKKGNADKDQFWKSNGLNVTSCWEYHVDPTDPKRHYVCFTDIGFIRSMDGGETWESAPDGSPWKNTFYSLAPDPAAKGRLIAAASNTHDIPYWRYVQRGQGGTGGLVISTNYGQTWDLLAGGPKQVGGLPDAPCTCVWLDERSPEKERTLWAVMYGNGVYRSTNAGKGWHKVMDGLRDDNDHYYRLHADAEGTLWLVVTANRDGSSFPVNGALYRYDGEKWDPDARRPEVPEPGKWSLVNNELAYPTDVAIDPDNDKVLLLCARDVTGGRVEGGCYRSIDAGRTWKRTYQSQVVFSATFSPTQKNVAWISTSNGLMRTEDGGATWSELPGLPFYNLTRVIENPADPDELRVCTFGGGAWKGPSRAKR